MSKLASSFLHDHRRIEAWLKRHSPAGEKRLGFVDLLHRHARRHKLLARHLDRLLALHGLRNAMVHTVGRRDRFVAEPMPHVVVELRRIADLLEAPPNLPADVFHPVHVFSLQDALRSVLRFMHQKGFSQVPVEDMQGQLVDVLTLQTVTRWLAAAMDADSVDLDAVPLAEVLPHQEHDFHYTFASSNSNCEEIFDLFVNAQSQGIALDVVMLTNNGQRQREIDGMVTVTDLPLLVESLGLE